MVLGEQEVPVQVRQEEAPLLTELKFFKVALTMTLFICMQQTDKRHC